MYVFWLLSHLLKISFLRKSPEHILKNLWIFLNSHLYKEWVYLGVASFTEVKEQKLKYLQQSLKQVFQPESLAAERQSY